MGRTISRWWLLAVIPVCIVCLPALMILFFAANNFAGAILGPPAIWNRPWHRLQATVLVGRYGESERNWTEARSAPTALELRRNGSAVVSNLPSEADLHTCVLSGVGTWSGPDEDGRVNIAFGEALTSSECHVTDPAYAAFEVYGHSQPYGLYLVIGDPDSGTGIWFRKQR